MALQGYLTDAARRRPEHVAVREPSGTGLSYRDLDRLSDRVRDRLVALGVRRGDRVGLYVHKSADGVAAIFGALKAGAAYVPVDPLAPAQRNAYIHANCAVKAVVVEECFSEAHASELAKLGASPHRIVLAGTGGGDSLRASLDGLDAANGSAPARTVESAKTDLAYILYTSGSTGKPKGVMLSHANACSFVDWCSREFDPRPEDRFSSHAPFHFDLSILDIYVPIKHAATLCLVPEELGKEPAGLAALIADQGITVWYSAPSILSLLAQSGKLAAHDTSALRLVLFAGEVFPVVHLRSTRRQLSRPRYFNLYGPTETNVCTSYEIPAVIPEERADPYPIGRVCPHLRGRVVDPDGAEVSRGAEGELCIAGEHVMQGYWGMPEETARSFLPDDGSGDRWYRTGDVVVEEPDGNLRYVGRRDRMIKKRGYRVELGEIEVCLYRHPGVREAAVVAVPDETLGMRVTAHLSTRDGGKLSTIELKRFCSENLPLYMVPDRFRFHAALPRTSTDKVDYQTLKADA
jgi:amino acid adenylation domain-containing protein